LSFEGEFVQSHMDISVTGSSDLIWLESKDWDLCQ
jgi:hypothetical protein